MKLAKWRRNESVRGQQKGGRLRGDAGFGCNGLLLHVAAEVSLRWTQMYENGFSSDFLSKSLCSDRRIKCL